MDSISKSLNTLFDNKTFSTSMSLLLALYAGAAAPALPNNVIVFFDTVIGKLLITFLIAYLSSKNIQLALMLAVAFVVSLNIINTNKINEGFRTIENYENDGHKSDGVDCDGLEGDKLDECIADAAADATDGDDTEEPESVEAVECNEDDADYETCVADAATAAAATNADEVAVDKQSFTDYEPFVPSTNMFSNTEQYYAPY